MSSQPAGAQRAAALGRPEGRMSRFWDGLRWLLAGVAFAACVALAIATAAIRTSNVKARARLQVLAERFEATGVAPAAARSDYRAACELPALVARWLEVEERLTAR